MSSLPCSFCFPFPHWVFSRWDPGSTQTIPLRLLCQDPQRWQAYKSQVPPFVPIGHSLSKTHSSPWLFYGSPGSPSAHLPISSQSPLPGPSPERVPRGPYLSSAISPRPDFSDLLHSSRMCLCALSWLLSSDSPSVAHGMFPVIQLTSFCLQRPLWLPPLSPRPLGAPPFLSPELYQHLCCRFSSHSLLASCPSKGLVPSFLRNTLESCMFLCSHTHCSSCTFYPSWFSWFIHLERRWQSMHNPHATSADPIIPFLTMLVFASHLFQNEIQTLSRASNTFCDWPCFHFQTYLFRSVSSVLRWDSWDCQKRPSPFLHGSHPSFQTQSVVPSSGEVSLTLHTPSPGGMGAWLIASGDILLCGVIACLRVWVFRQRQEMCSFICVPGA